MDTEVSPYNSGSGPQSTQVMRVPEMSVQEFVRPACEMQQLSQITVNCLPEHMRRHVSQPTHELDDEHQRALEKSSVHKFEANNTPIQRYGDQLTRLAKCLRKLTENYPTPVFDVPVLGLVDGIFLSGSLDKVEVDVASFVGEADFIKHFRLCLNVYELEHTGEWLGSFEHEYTRIQLLVYHDLFYRMLDSPENFLELIRIKGLAYKESHHSQDLVKGPCSLCKSLSDDIKHLDIALKGLLQRKVKIILLKMEIILVNHETFFSEVFFKAELESIIQNRKMLSDQQTNSMPDVTSFESPGVSDVCQYKSKRTLE